ncbi:hypothetical protein [Nannocystis sp. SCPEA4]|uniref:hypothetical protein n=1 Tax=Nannocystis sp. SCPEA4 TaxID=2996787 RepID=UPI0022711FE1|nr:hypothetical protein [Nannocystis sp. SCPEA4]MCY1054020.1 hypothetical protein [Nannocystis sp. SCPEA4]
MSKQRSIEEVEAFWKQAIPATFNFMAGDQPDPEATRQLDKLPADLSPETARRIYSFYLGEVSYLLWGTLTNTPDALVETLVACLREAERKNSSVQARVLLAAFELAGAAALREAAAVLRLTRSSYRLESATKKLPGLHPSPGLARAAAEVVANTTSEINTLEVVAFWSLVWVAAQARPEIFDELEARAAQWKHEPLLKQVRATPMTAKPEKVKPPSLLPAKVSQVKKWLAANPGVDPAVFGRRDKQKTDEKAAAIRALTTLATPAALEVLTSYRPRDGEIWGLSFGGGIPAELTRAWNTFDRKHFGELMFAGIEALSFQGDAGSLLTDIRGIEAARDLRSLILGPDPSCDLSPLASCPALFHLELYVLGRTDALEPLARIPSLKWLAIYNGDKLEQAAIDSIGQAKKLTQLSLSIDGPLDLRPLLELEALERLRFAGSDELDTRTIPGLAALLERGVPICFYSHQNWWRVLSDPESPFVVRGVEIAKTSRYPVLCKDGARARKLDEQLAARSFFGS